MQKVKHDWSNCILLDPFGADIFWHSWHPKDDRIAGIVLDQGRNVCYNQCYISDVADVWYGNRFLRTYMINDFWLRPLYFVLGFVVCLFLFIIGVI